MSDAEYHARQRVSAVENREAEQRARTMLGIPPDNHFAVDLSAERIAALEAENSRLRPVVEAARAWCDSLRVAVNNPDRTARQHEQTMQELVNAVCAYEAQKEEHG